MGRLPTQWRQDDRGFREGRVGMNSKADTLLLFGATGDLAQRMLLPSLCALDADGLLAPELEIIGTARSAMSDAEFRNFARAALEKYLPADRRGRSCGTRRRSSPSARCR